MSKLCVNQIQSIIAGKSFEEVRKVLSEKNIVIKEKNGDLSNLYLVFAEESSQTENVNQNVNTEESSGGENVNTLHLQCNGLIFEKETNRIVATNQNKLIDVKSPEDMVQILRSKKCEPVITSSNSEVRVEYCEDGTIMRLYFYNDKWYTATTKCMDARDSFWSSAKTFDAMFWETFNPSWMAMLDKRFTYHFILLHPENNIVVKHKHNNLVFVSSINNETLEENYRNVFFEVNRSRGIWRPKVIPYFDVINIESYFNSTKRGVLVKLYNQDMNSWEVYKLDFENYKTIKDVRGNVPQIRMRFVELLSDSAKLIMLEKFFPEHRFMFAVIRNSLNKLVNEVYKLYVESHIKHTVQVTEDNKFHRTLRQLHAQYKNTNKPISIQDVEAKIFSLDKFALKKLLGWV